MKFIWKVVLGTTMVVIAAGLIGACGNGLLWLTGV